MPKPPERGYVEFHTPLLFNSPEFKRAVEIIDELKAVRTVAVQYIGRHAMKSLSFETKEQAMLFKLRF